MNIGSNLYLVFEFMTQDLRRYMDNANGMGADGQRPVKSYMYQMMRWLWQYAIPRIIWYM